MPSPAVIRSDGLYCGQQPRKSNLDLQINELRRDLTSAYAKSFLSFFEQARISSNEWLNDVEERLFKTLWKLAGTTNESRAIAAELIALSNGGQRLPRHEGAN